MRSIDLSALDPTDFSLLNDWQRDFPLQPRPYAHIGACRGLSVDQVLARYRRLERDGLISRIGAVFAPRRLGASALAALAVPPERLEEVAARVSREPAVNHNYQREHPYNLWFVLTAASEAGLQAVVAGIVRDTGFVPIVLPMEEEFHIDLGFDLRTRPAVARRVPVSPHFAPSGLSGSAQALIQALQGGLELVPAPFAALGARAGCDEASTLAQLGAWVESGLIRRFGVIVHHHELGFEANAMCVWDVSDERVSALGRALAAEPAVTLCYRRRRALPHWRYNLYCMIHGREREEVLAIRKALQQRLGLDACPHAVLFSTRRYKQTGAQYLASPAGREEGHG